MTRLMKMLLVLVVLSGLTACKSVTSDQLIGVPVDAEEAKTFEGVWDLDDGIVCVKQLDGANLKAALIDWDDEKGEFKLNQMHIVVTKLADSEQNARFVQMVAEEEEDSELDLGEAGDADTEKSPWLLLGLMNTSGDDALVMYGPKFGVFEEAVRSGALKGTVNEDGNTVHIQADKAALDAFVAGQPRAELFEMDDPGVMTRVGGGD